MKKGFTLVELVIVIVILGILAAVAIPKFVDLSTQAREAACRGALGGLRSAMSIFYAQQAVAGTARFPTTTTEVANAMAQGVPPNPYVTDANSTVILATGSVITGTTADAAWIYNTNSTDTGTSGTFGRIWAAANATATSW